MDKNNPKKLDEVMSLSDLKTKAESMGVEFAKNIGAESLSKRIAGFEKSKEKSQKAKPRKLTRKEEAKIKSTSLSKVRIVNMDRENASAKTVFASVHNMSMDLARVIPLNMDIALEEALIRNIENRKMMIPEAVIGDNGKPTGNFKMVEAAAYAVARL